MLNYTNMNAIDNTMRGSACRVNRMPVHEDPFDYPFKFHQMSPTSTLSSGYNSCQSEIEIDDFACPGNPEADESDYFLLESDQYVCLKEQTDSRATDEKLKQVRDSMLKIVMDLESLGFETSLDELSSAVRSSVRKSKPCRRASTSSAPSLSRRAAPACSDSSSLYTKSPVDVMLTKINHMTDRSDRERLYDRLITNIAKECDTSSSDGEDEPIYEEIGDFNDDFDFVAHSDTYRKSGQPPALPPRSKALSSGKHGLCAPTFLRQVSLPESRSDRAGSGINERKAKSCQAINTMERIH